MKTLIFGGNGQLGKELTALTAVRGITAVVVDLPEVNICEPLSIEKAVAAAAPDVIINAAAYTAVDKAESERDLAYKVNAEGAINLALAAKKAGCRFLHVSTDYVFGDGFDKPITEDAATNPLNVYGASKLEGERGILAEYAEGTLIVRTASLHGQYGHNFVHTMLRLFKEREQVSVVTDQVMSPTWAGWLAKALLELAQQDCLGVVHASCGEAVSWFDFAQAILEYSQVKSPSKVKLLPILAADYPSAAKRASYSVLDVTKLRGLTSDDFVIGWREGLKSHLKNLGEC